jgi:hypothetical protein
MSDEWGPWIEHDGNGCPIELGVLFQVRFDDRPPPKPRIMIARLYGFWDACEDLIIKRPTLVIRYRTRKPRGMVILEKLLADMPRVGELEVI